MDRRSVLMATGLGLVGAVVARADPPTPFAGDPQAPQWPPAERFPLWPKGPAGAPSPAPRPNWTMNGGAGHRELWIRGVAVPEVAVIRPAKPDGSAILALPGGGYEFLSTQNEGIDVGRRFTPAGTTVFVLTYRLPGEGWSNRSLAPLADAQRAMRLIRARAASFGVDPAKLGVMGFSAGGHLAADLTTSHAEHAYQPVDQADQLSARPAFSALIYPVTTVEQGQSHKGSRDNLLGPDPSTAAALARSPVRHIVAGTSPSFLVHAFDDGTVPVQNSLDWIAGCRAAQVPVEALLLETGGHGFGLHLPATNSGSHWPDLFLPWMRRHVGIAG